MMEWNLKNGANRNGRFLVEIMHFFEVSIIAFPVYAYINDFAKKSLRRYLRLPQTRTKKDTPFFETVGDSGPFGW